uniref:DUF4136 domain-containing protein n=1 Tax=Roseihalotalea indica TaxID=2867963 RepID=A0AA49JHR8_9BACT|nr:DUF4136 domain-containing protein [Tunicatimonas sp. TK19036]
MTYRYIFFLIILSSIILACSPIKILSEAPEAQEVNHFKTFAFMQVDEKQMDQASLVLYDEIRKSITAQLRQKAYQIDTENPELLIAFNILTDEQRKEVTKSADPYGAYGRMWPYNPYYRGWYPTNQYRYKEIQIQKTGTMIIDMFDNQKQALVWRGLGIGPVNNPEERFETAYKMVDKIFKAFPESVGGSVSVSK